jgi:hypothetical protein
MDFDTASDSPLTWVMTMVIEPATAIAYEHSYS